MRTTKAKKKAEAIEVSKSLTRTTKARVVSDFPTDKPDERYTPPTIVRELHRIYRFTVDAFSHPSTPAAQIIGAHWTERDDALALTWRDHRVFCQPPYSRLAECIGKGFSETSAGCPLAVFLVPAWTDREWWAEFVEAHRDRPFDPLSRSMGAPRKVKTRFLPGRMTFGNPAQPDIEAETARRKAAGEEAPTQAQFGMCLIEFWGRIS
jgi:hypothetical protein